MSGRVRSPVRIYDYQWWLNPARAVKRRLGEVAATLSMPAGESQVARVARLARLRRSLAENVHVRAGGIGPRADIARRGARRGRGVEAVEERRSDVHFADLRITIESEAAARAYLTVEVTTPDPQGRPTVDTRDATVTLARQNGQWVIAEAKQKSPRRVPEIPSRSSVPRSRRLLSRPARASPARSLSSVWPPGGLTGTEIDTSLGHAPSAPGRSPRQ